MAIRQEALFKIKSVELEKKGVLNKVSSYFGENTFNIETMQKHISKKTFDAFKRWMNEGVTITLEQANELSLIHI